MFGLALAVAAGALWKQLTPPPPARHSSKLVSRELPGLTLRLPDGVTVENAGYILAGRFSSEDKATGLRAQVGWTEAAGKLERADMFAIQQAWLGALAAGGLAPALSEVAGESRVAGHAAVRAAGLGQGGTQYRATTWVCPESQRVIHVLLSGPVKFDLELDGPGVECHSAKAAAVPREPRAKLTAPEFKQVSVTGTRRTYLGPNGVVDVVLEEGPRPAGSPVAHVLSTPDVWGPLLSGVLGRPLPVDAPGASRVEKLSHGHEAVRVHGRVQPPATPQQPLAPVLYVETTVWVCPRSDRMVSLSAVTPDRKALERARAALDGVVCH